MGPEKTFETKVKKFIEDQNCWVVKFFANRMTKKGIPDIICCINGYFVAVEIKAVHGEASDLQIYHCKKIREANGFAFILYPSGFDQFKKFVEGLHNDTYTRDMPLFLK